MLTTFHELPLGARFQFRGRRYQKEAPSVASDENRCGCIFMDDAEVLWDRQPGEQPNPPRKPDPRHWTDYLTPAPEPAPMRRPPASG